MSADRVPGVVLLVAGAAIGLEATTFDVGFLTDPVGPKALPALVAAMLVLSGVDGLVRPRRDTRWPARRTRLRIAAAALAFVAYAVALGTIGFFTSTTLVLAALGRLFGAPKRAGVVTALLLSGGLWLLFVVVLGLPLPIGSLWMR